MCVNTSAVPDCEISPLDGGVVPHVLCVTKLFLLRTWLHSFKLLFIVTAETFLHHVIRGGSRRSSPSSCIKTVGQVQQAHASLFSVWCHDFTVQFALHKGSA